MAVYIVEFLLFLVYTVLIFFIKNYFLLGIIAIANVILMIILKENIKKAFLAILKLMPIIIFTSIINIIMSDINSGITIGIRLILVCNMTYIFSKKMTPQKLQYCIETILKPLKILKINSKEIGIIVCIGISFIPIIQKEMQEIKNSLKAKGYNLNPKNIIKNPNYILIPLITGTIKKINDIEASLLSKGYVA